MEKEIKKQIILSELCARLPYEVKVKFYSMEYPYGSEPVILTVHLLKDRWENILDIKPYLRPMSSMTKDEIEEAYWVQNNAIRVDFYKYEEGYEKSIDMPSLGDLIDFYNSHHLDYRGLIEKGLALEAPEDMYK